MEILETILSYGKKKLLMSILCFTAMFFTAGLMPVFPVQLQEHQVKAVFLYNFSQFVQWPDSAFANEDSIFVIGLFGKDPFGAFLEEILRGESFNNRPFVIRKYDSPKDVGHCHILYFGDHSSDELKAVLDELHGKSILTVGDAQGFGEMGGIIAFERRNNKVMLKINQNSARKAQLQISPKLLRLAEVVPSENIDRP